MLLVEYLVVIAAVEDVDSGHKLPVQGLFELDFRLLDVKSLEVVRHH